MQGKEGAAEAEWNYACEWLVLACVDASSSGNNAIVLGTGHHGVRGFL